MAAINGDIRRLDYSSHDPSGVSCNRWSNRAQDV